ncbi:hypothetical protein FACS1894122_13410 [Alphaproteobacteria bacterium]|nr:hypothetical protein FACS1894122_13410 [Alphaproteobacteria bacterium]
MPIGDFIITVFVCIDDFLKNEEKLRRRGPAPELTDAEVPTMETVGKCRNRRPAALKSERSCMFLR